MKKKINKIVFPVVSLLIFLSLFFVMNKAFAAAVNPASTRYGLDTTISAGGLAAPFSVKDVNDAGPGQYISSKVGQLVGSILSFIGVILLILIIYAGILWMTSAGNEKKTEQAKNILVSAIIGLVIVLSAYAITAFIGRQLTETGALPPSTTTTTPPVTCNPPKYLNGAGECVILDVVCISPEVLNEDGDGCIEADVAE